MSTRVSAWEVHDSGLVTAPGRFRRLTGRVRHHAPQGDRWPGGVVLEVGRGEVRITGHDGGLIGAYPETDVVTRLVSCGPPVTFVLDVPGEAHLLAAASGPETTALLSVLSPTS
ncbi:MAG: hypothetical protein Q8K58_03880 [Acidimicrobiales bacterium]|nr:hypothetical protein [Acidimicrobiales bacterium]